MTTMSCIEREAIRPDTFVTTLVSSDEYTHLTTCFGPDSIANETLALLKSLEPKYLRNYLTFALTKSTSQAQVFDCVSEYLFSSICLNDVVQRNLVFRSTLLITVRCKCNMPGFYFPITAGTLTEHVTNKFLQVWKKDKKVDQERPFYMELYYDEERCYRLPDISLFEIVARQIRQTNGISLKKDTMTLFARVVAGEPKSEETFNIQVLSLNGGSFDVSLSMNDTVWHLMTIVQQKTTIPIKDQRLIFAGRQLDSNHSLNTYNLVENSRVNVMIRLRGC